MNLKPEGKRSRVRNTKNVRLILKIIIKKWYEGMDLVYLAQIRICWWVLVNMVKKKLLFL